MPTAGEERLSHRRLGTRRLTTVFGAVELVRMGCFRPGLPSIFPLDQALALPARSFSYELQRRLIQAAAQNPFLESVETIAELRCVRFPNAAGRRSCPTPPKILTPSTASALPIRPVSLCWSPRSTAKAFPLLNRWLHGGRFVSPKGRNPIRNAWPPSPPCSPARLGCAPHNSPGKFVPYLVSHLPRQVHPPASGEQARLGQRVQR